MSVSVDRLLAEKDWPGLARFFAERQPSNAREFQARAFYALNQGAAARDWTPVLSDFQRACALEPQDAMLRANLAQALLDSRQPQLAYEAAQEAARLDPRLFPAWEKLAFAAAATARWDESLGAMQKAKLALQGAALPPTAARLMVQLEARWWQPVHAGTIALRIPQEQHRGFLERSFADRGFMRHFHRFQPAGADAVNRFLAAAQQSPLVTRRIDWVVCHQGGPCLGLAGLVDVDWANGRAELLVGFPYWQGPNVALQATAAAMRFAFRNLRLEKLVSFVYGDNPRAQENTLRLGFAQEGYLRRHIAGDGQRIDLYMNGMLREDYEGNPFLRKLEERWSA